MKLTTKIAAHFDSVGKPQSAESHSSIEVRELPILFAKWIRRIYMGSHIRITVARNESELDAILSGGRLTADTDMLAELESILSQEDLPLGDDEPSLLDSGDEH